MTFRCTQLYLMLRKYRDYQRGAADSADPVEDGLNQDDPSEENVYKKYD